MALPTDNAESGIKISEMKIKVYDCGNIKAKSRNLEDLFTQIHDAVFQILSQIINSKVFIVGGTDDLLFPVLKASSQIYQGLNLLRIDPALDVKPKFMKRFDDEVEYFEHHLSHFRMILEDESIVKSLKQTTFFGLHGHKVTQKELDYVKSQIDCTIIYFEKDIKRN